MNYKHKVSLTLIVFVIFITVCEERLNKALYQPVLPPVPYHWLQVLGEPHWRLKWLEEDGNWQTREVAPYKLPPGIAFVPGWTTPVFAWPYWPDRAIPPGAMRPSGALFPWDAANGRITLCWQGGVDAFFWKALAAAERTTGASSSRFPWHFAWPAFRALFESEIISEAVRGDPWLADWLEIARRTVQSGFDRRRIVARPVTEIAIPDLDGFWVGSSPFAQPLLAPPGGPLVINAADKAGTWVSIDSILKSSSSGWVLIRE